MKNETSFHRGMFRYYEHNAKINYDHWKLTKSLHFWNLYKEHSIQREYHRTMVDLCVQYELESLECGETWSGTFKYTPAKFTPY